MSLQNDILHWSKENPGHFPLSVNLDFKGAYHSKFKYLTPLIVEKSQYIVQSGFQLLEEMIVSTYNEDRERLFTPVDMKNMSSSSFSTFGKQTTSMSKAEEDKDSDDQNNHEKDRSVFTPLSSSCSQQSLRVMVNKYGWPDVRDLQNKTMFMLNLYGYKKMFRFDAAHPNSAMFVRGQVRDSSARDHRNDDDGDNSQKVELLSISTNTAGTHKGGNAMHCQYSKKRTSTMENAATDDTDHVYLEDNAGYEQTKEYVQNRNRNSLLRMTILGSGSKRDDDAVRDARIKLNQLLKDGVIHLVASNHPFHLHTNMILRNGLWNGDTNNYADEG